MEKVLYPKLWEIIIKNDCIPLAVNGVEDHVHILVKLDSKISISKLMQSLKGKSAKIINDSYLLIDHFIWQRGYGAFSIQEKDVPRIIKYIKNQKEHHKNHSIEEDFEI